MNGTRFSEDLAAFDFFTVDAAEKSADVVACFSTVEDLTEHFNARNNRIFRFVSEADDFNCVANFEFATFNTACSNSAAACDGEDVFDRHEERLVRRALRSRDVFVNSIHQFEDGRFADFAFVAFEGFESRANYDRNFVAGEIVGAEEITNFHFNEFDEFRIVNLVSFVEVYDDSRYTNLAGQEDVFTSLGHRAVSSGNDEDSAVHLSSTGDHVLDIVSMAWAVNVCIVTFVCFIFNVCRVDCNTTFTFFRSLVDISIVFEFSVAFFSQNFGDGSCQSSFAVVDVTDRANVNMRFGSFVMFFSHLLFLQCELNYISLFR